MVGQTPAITIGADKAESVPLLTGTSLKLHEGWNTFANPYLFPITLAQLEEVQVTTGLLMEMVPHTPHWRLRKAVFHPLISAAWTLLPGAIVTVSPTTLRLKKRNFFVSMENCVNIRLMISAASNGRS